MPDRQSTIWERKPHTAAKHAILRRYLGAWFPKLAWRGRVLFVDGFAGPGQYAGGEPGSPVIALRTALDHKYNLGNCELVYLFIERDRDRFAHLQALVGSLELPPNVKCRAIRGEFSDVVGQILDEIEAGDARLAPAFFMIDPFGFAGMPYALIERIAEHPRSEFLISFMYESIVRWRTHPDHEATFDRLFGCEEWREADAINDTEEKKKFLLGLYASQLKSTGMDYVRSFEMRDEGNRTEYFLIFATHSIDGLKAMKDAMWTVDPTGSFRFSDATVSTQLTLLSPEPDYHLLRSLIVSKFGSQEVRVEDVERFVLVETPFRETHYKRQVLAALERQGKIEVTRSPRKKRFTYPPGTVIRFP